MLVTHTTSAAWQCSRSARLTNPWNWYVYHQTRQLQARSADAARLHCLTTAPLQEKHAALTQLRRLKMPIAGLAVLTCLCGVLDVLAILLRCADAVCSPVARGHL